MRIDASMCSCEKCSWNKEGGQHEGGRRRLQAALQCRVQQGDIVVSLGKCSGADARLCLRGGWGDPEDPRPDCHVNAFLARC